MVGWLALLKPAQRFYSDVMSFNYKGEASPNQREISMVVVIARASRWQAVVTEEVSRTKTLIRFAAPASFAGGKQAVPWRSLID